MGSYNMSRQLKILISEADYAALRREAYELRTTMSALVRLRLGHPQVVPAVKPISVTQAPMLVEDDEDVPPKSDPTM
jgi:hypothetical protein